MNAFWDATPDLRDQSQDFRFIYLGRKGSFTGFHEDVLRSYSWSTNVSGRKRWLFVLPGEEIKLKCRGQYPSSLHRSAIPLLITRESGSSNISLEVENLEDTLSINHNWGNAANLHILRCFMCEEHKAAERNIADCAEAPEFPLLCQRMVKPDCGINHADFLSYCVYNAGRVLQVAASIGPGHFEENSGYATSQRTVATLYIPNDNSPLYSTSIPTPDPSQSYKAPSKHRSPSDNSNRCSYPNDLAPLERAVLAIRENDPTSAEAMLWILFSALRLCVVLPPTMEEVVRLHVCDHNETANRQPVLASARDVLKRLRAFIYACGISVCDFREFDNGLPNY
eukprot:Rmarinus@m.27168